MSECGIGEAKIKKSADVGALFAWRFCWIPYANRTLEPAQLRFVVQPGTILRGNSWDRTLIVQGNLQAIGVLESPITLSAVADGPGNWDGLSINGGGMN